jgi:Flp pilus assembly protein TadD
VTKIDVLIQKGTENLRNSNFENALSFFEQALLLKPDDPDLWNNKGIVLRSLGRYDEASDCYNKSLQLDPRDRASS